jgi:hypothetical protein
LNEGKSRQPTTEELALARYFASSALVDRFRGLNHIKRLC